MICPQNGMVVPGQANPAGVFASCSIVQRMGFVSRTWLEGLAARLPIGNF